MNTPIVITRKPINTARELTLTILTGGLWGCWWAIKVLYRKFDR